MVFSEVSVFSKYVSARTAHGCHQHVETNIDARKAALKSVTIKILHNYMFFLFSWAVGHNDDLRDGDLLYVQRDIS